MLDSAALALLELDEILGAIRGDRSLAMRKSAALALSKLDEFLELSQFPPFGSWFNCVIVLS
jgi:hypothetical protein